MQIRPEMVPTLVIIGIAFCGTVGLLILAFLGAVFHVGPMQYRWITRDARAAPNEFLNQPNFRDTAPMPTVNVTKRVDDVGETVLNGN